MNLPRHLRAFLLIFLQLQSSHGVTGSAEKNEPETRNESALYDDNYDDNYDTEEAFSEEPMPTLQVKFITEAQHFKVTHGGLIRLPCQVERLGPLAITWKKPIDNSTNYQILSVDNKSTSWDPRVSQEYFKDHGSTLIISSANEGDVGVYECEISSNPQATLRHQVSLIAAPKVQILKPKKEEYKIHPGQELALVCHGFGEPPPNLSWKREKKRMPDGRSIIHANEIIFKNVTRLHSGTYICEGSYGSEPIAQDSIKVEVLHPPEIIPEQSTLQQKNGIDLELICLVHASPRPDVFWYKNGALLDSTDDPFLRIKYRMRNIGRKHSLTLSGFVESDNGDYACKAENEMGKALEVFHIYQGQQDPPFTGRPKPLSSHSHSDYEPIGEMADEMKTLKSRMQKEEMLMGSGADARSIIYWHLVALLSAVIMAHC